MKDFKSIYKALAKTKNNTAAEIYQLCIYKALTAKSALTHEDRVTIAYNQLIRAFIPITNVNKLNNGMTPWITLYLASRRQGLNTWGNQAPDWNETDLEKESYRRLRDDVLKRFSQKEQEKYTYIFVNKQLSSKEYMLVQSSHVAFELGNTLRIEGIKTDGLNFVICGAKSEEHLLEIEKKIQTNGYKTVSFREPDINNITTAIASYPIPFTKKYFMKGYQILRFGD
jgi:hypothetical protein